MLDVRQNRRLQRPYSLARSAQMNETFLPKEASMPAFRKQVDPIPYIGFLVAHEQLFVKVSDFLKDIPANEHVRTPTSHCCRVEVPHQRNQPGNSVRILGHMLISKEKTGRTPMISRQ